MKAVQSLLSAVCLLAAVYCHRAEASVTQYELYANIHTVGISIRFDTAAPANSKGITYISVRNSSGWSPAAPGFELSKVTANYYAGCVFHTNPGTWYRIRSVITAGNLVLADVTDSVLTRTEPLFPVAQRTFYVSPSGSGISQNRNVPGSLDQGLIDGLKAGDKVVLLEGIYFTGGLNLASSGTANAPIVFEGENDLIVIDGSSPTPVLWTRVTNDTASRDYNMFYSNLGNINTNDIIVNGKRLYPYRNLLELSLHSSIRAIDVGGFPNGVFPLNLDGFFRDGRNSAQNHFPWIGYNPNTYIKFADKSDTIGKDIRVSVRNYAFGINQLEHIQFRRIRFRYFGAAAQSNSRCAILANDADQLLIDSCQFEFCDRALVFTGNSDRNTVQNCRITDDLAKLSYFQFKETGLDYQHLNSNYPNFFPFQARNIEPGRIYFDRNFTGRGNIVRYNYISGGCDGITCPSTPGDSTTARHFDIYGNEFGPGSDDAFELDGDAGNIRVWGNLMYGAANGISVASPCYGPVYIFRNVMRDFRKTVYQYVVNITTLITDTIPGSPVKLNAAYCDIPGMVYFMHNTVSSGKDAYGLVLFQPQTTPSWSKFTAKNNIIYSNSHHYTLWVRATDSIDLDYNIYYCTQGFLARQDRQFTGLYSDFNTARQAILGNIQDTGSSIEKHGEYLNPFAGWVDPGNGNFRLKSGSPVIDKGVVLFGLNDDFKGTAPDAGAFEFDGNTGIPVSGYKTPVFSVYPNPASDAFHIVPSIPGLEYQMQICTLQGRIIAERMIKNNVIINVTGLPTGMYLLTLKSTTGSATIKLFIQ